MVKVLLITKLFDPVIGGVETVVRQLAASLGNDERFSVTVLAGNEKRCWSTTSYTYDNAVIVKAAGAGLLYNTALSPAYLFLFRKLVKEHDVIHFHSPNPLGEIAFNFFKISAGKKVIVSVHADLSATRKKRFAPLFNALIKNLLSRADTITTMSPQNMAGMAVLQPFLTKTVVVPLAYDDRQQTGVTPADKMAFSKRHLLDANRNTILFAGRLTPDKGLQHLLAAMYRLKDVQLIVAGDGELKKQLLKQAAEVKGNKIIFTGFLNSIELATAFSLSQVFVLPSVNETFGIGQAEAMRFGLPVINTALGTGVNFVSINGETGITVPPANEKALAAAIEKIFADEDFRLYLSANARKRSHQFSPEKMTNALKELYLA